MPEPQCRTVCQLNFAEQIVVWSVRTWLGGPSGRVRVAAELETAFGAAEGARAAAALGGMIETIGTSARRTVTIGPAPCPRLWSDEELLLTALRCLHTGQETAATRVFAEILPPSAARMAIEHADSLVNTLLRAGYPIGRADQRLDTRDWAEAERPPTIH